MAIVPWITNTDEKIQDHLGFDILFKKTVAQINCEAEIDANLNVIRRLGEAPVVCEAEIDTQLTVRKFMSSRIIATSFVNAQANEAITQWATIMFRYIGER